MAPTPLTLRAIEHTPDSHTYPETSGPIRNHMGPDLIDTGIQMPSHNASGSTSSMAFRALNSGEHGISTVSETMSQDKISRHETLVPTVTTLSQRKNPARSVLRSSISAGGSKFLEEKLQSLPKNNKNNGTHISHPRENIEPSLADLIARASRSNTSKLPQETVPRHPKTLHDAAPMTQNLISTAGTQLLASSLDDPSSHTPFLGNVSTRELAIGVSPGQSGVHNSSSTVHNSSAVPPQGLLDGPGDTSLTDMIDEVTSISSHLAIKTPNASPAPDHRENPPPSREVVSVASRTSLDADMEVGSPGSSEEIEDMLEYVDVPAHLVATRGSNLESRSISTSPPSDDHPPRQAGIRRSSRISSASGSASNDPLDSIFDDPLGSPPPASRSTTPEEVVTSVRKFGGFPALTWHSYRQNLRNFVPKCYYTKDLPHSLQDYINLMSNFTRQLPGMRDIFEAAAQQNTVDDEPFAPPIKVLNDIDSEPTPPWEFHYSNKLWHGEGVPPPDITNLVSCDCIGKCDPKSKTCACLKKQQSSNPNNTLDFAYDVKGRLKEPGYPIFECNDLCRCGDECRNRVVQHGRKCAVVIKKTLKKGWGVFAHPQGKKILKGSYIGHYAGEILTDAMGEERGVLYNKSGRTYLFDIDFYHLRIDNENWENKYVVDAYHAGNFTRFLNHSCDPNCKLHPCYINESDIDKPWLTVFAERDIEPGEEICFSYSGDPDCVRPTLFIFLPVNNYPISRRKMKVYPLNHRHQNKKQYTSPVHVGPIIALVGFTLLTLLDLIFWNRRHVQIIIIVNVFRSFLSIVPRCFYNLCKMEVIQPRANHHQLL
ncbi:hypothetical protein BD779DRAFT_255631 [Infundibulicybe gibba]|nr:hypothetical protein BD779DRAFT_255631 [Infundibulicybe gibba]